MPSVYEQTLRQMVKLEFCADHDVQQALKNVRKIFGFHAIDTEIVQQWFKSFEQDKIEQSKNSTEYHNSMNELFPNGADKKICRQILAQVKDSKLDPSTITTNDGRFGYCIKDQNFAVVDFFHGEVR
jgi:hypothetical protein